MDDEKYPELKNEYKNEYKDFALETYRHASRYGDSPCDHAFIPRRGVFFWPMEKSPFDQRRFRLWARVLNRMEKDNILILAEEDEESPSNSSNSPNKNVHYRDARYFFHPDQFRPPYYKSQKLNWPHVKEWYFEFMNNTDESTLLLKSMTRLEAYLDRRDSNEEVKAFDPFPIASQKQTKILRLPLIKKPEKPDCQLRISCIPGLKYSNELIATPSPDIGKRIYSSPPGILGPHPPPFCPQFSDTVVPISIKTSPVQALKALPASLPGIEPKDRNSHHSTGSDAMGSVASFKTCPGCSRCSYHLEYPDDRFEGRVRSCPEEGSLTRSMCDRIICHECMKIYDDPGTETFKRHLESPEHTRNVLLRLRQSGEAPIDTPSAKKRSLDLGLHASQKGFLSISEYILRGPRLSSQDSVGLHTHTGHEINPLKSDSISKSIITPPDIDIKTSDQCNHDKNGVDIDMLCPETIGSKDEGLFREISQSGNENKLPKLASDEKPNATENIVNEKINTLYMRQLKINNRLDSLETYLNTAQISLDDISHQVQTGTNRTYALLRSFLQHDDAMKLLQKESYQGKAINDIMEGAFDAMTGHTSSEVVNNRLDRQEKEVMALRKELQDKVDDLSCWLKVVDRHTNEITCLKQRVWIHGQMNYSGESESYRALIQKLEYQLRIQEEATRTYMIQHDQRFEAMVRQFSDQINFLRQVDQEKQKQIINLKAQMGLKFAHIEQKYASLRKMRR